MTDIAEFEDALRLIALKYSELDVSLAKAGWPGLAERDWCWSEWSLQIESLARLLRVEDERPSVESLAALGANLAALLVAVNRAELLDVSSGEAA